MLHDGAHVARARQLRVVDARIRLVRRARQSARLNRLQRRLSLRQARRRSRAQARTSRRCCPGVYFLWAMFAIALGTSRSRRASSSIGKSIQYGLQSGDHLHAGYSAARRFSHLQFRGMPLAELREDAHATMGLLHRISDAANAEFLGPRMRLIDWLQGERQPRQHARRRRARRDAPARPMIQARGNRSFESDWFMLLAMQRYPLRAISRRPTSSRDRGRAASSSAPASSRASSTRCSSRSRSRPSIRMPTPAQRAEYDGELARNRELLRQLGGVMPRELRPHAAARRGRVRADCRRAHRSGGSLRPCDRRGARRRRS